MDNFIDELASLNILDKLDKGPNIDPNNNYELFAQLIKYARENIFQWLKFVTRRRNTHGPNGILNSINTKDQLYKILMQTDTDNVELFNRSTQRGI